MKQCFEIPSAISPVSTPEPQAPATPAQAAPARIRSATSASKVISVHL
jgi:hypothetical protein